MAEGDHRLEDVALSLISASIARHYEVTKDVSDCLLRYKRGEEGAGDALDAAVQRLIAYLDRGAKVGDDLPRPPEA